MISLIFSILCYAGFVQLELDQSSYSVGEKALVVASIKHQSTDPNKELFIRWKEIAEGNAPNFVTISNSLSVAAPTFQSAGSHVYSVEVLLQDRYLTQNFEETIASLESDRLYLERRLEFERDPEIIQEIQKSIADLDEQIDTLKENLEQERTLLEILPLEIQVTAAQQRSLSTFDLVSESPTFEVGQRAKFNATPNTNFEGPNGPYELVWKGNFLGLNLGAIDKGNSYQFVSKTLTSADLGLQEFSLALALRSKRQGDLLRTSFQQIKNRIGSFEERKKNSFPARHPYFNKKIAELNTIRNFLNEIFENTTPIESKSVSVNIVPGAL